MKKNKSIFNNFAVTVMMLLIVVAFVFTGVQGFTNSSNKVAVVDDKIVTPQEFNRALQANIDEVSQRNGGKYPSQKQIRDLGIQDNVISQLVDQKILLRFAENLGFGAGKEAVKDTIISQYAAFKTNNQFDITKYKNLLKLNGIQVKDFEKDVIDQVKVNKLNELFAAVQPSQKYLDEQTKVRNSEAIVNAISFDKEKMVKNLPVSDTEINAFLKDDVKANAVISTLYESYKISAPKDKLKSKDEMKNTLAKEHIQKTKRDELKTFNNELKQELKTAFENNQWSKIESISKKNGLDLKKKVSVNLLNPSIPGVSIDQENFVTNFTKKNTNAVMENDTPLAISFVKITGFNQKEVQKNDPFAQFAKFSQSRTLSFQAIDYQRGKSDIKKYNIVLQ